MLSTEEMKNMSTAKWMQHSQCPPIHEWLAPQRTRADEERMNQIGNIVVPGMAQMATSILSQIAK